MALDELLDLNEQKGIGKKNSRQMTVSPRRDERAEDHQEPTDPGCSVVAHMAAWPQEGAPTVKHERCNDADVPCGDDTETLQ